MVETAEEFIERKIRIFQTEKENNRIKKIRDINDGASHHFVREAWTFMRQWNHPEKVFVIERFARRDIVGDYNNKQLKIGNKEYRFGYFIIAKKGNANGKWWWGQSCPLIPIEDLEKLFAKAKKEGTIEI